MPKMPLGGFSSFRKPVKKVSAFPQTRSRVTQVWRPKISERVWTPSGMGTVVEISEDMYLIDLENQVANVWERLSSLKPPK